MYVCKLTFVSFVCMYVGRKSEMLVIISVFFNSSFDRQFSTVARKNVSFYGVCIYVRPKLTFLNFFLFFLCTFPY